MIKNLLDWIETERFRIRPTASLSTTDLEDGKMEYKDGILYQYDVARSRWVSVNRECFIFGRNGTTNNQYLNFSSGGISSNSGYRPIRNAVITGMSVQSSNQRSYDIHLRKNGTDSNIATLSLTNSYGKARNDYNVLVASTEFIQCYLEFTQAGLGVADPIVMVELAWRG